MRDLSPNTHMPWWPGPVRAFSLLTLAAAVAIVACTPAKDAKGDAKPPAGADKGKPGGPGGKSGPMAFAVEVEPVVAQTVDFAVRAVGSVAAFEEVQVTARVAGVLEHVDFAEGQTVTAGQVLADIEPQRFRVAEAQAQAQLQRAKATLKDASKTLARQQQLGAEVGTGADIDAARAKVDLAHADIAAAKAAVDLAQLNRRDAKVRAGMTGVIQSRKVATGQYVTPGSILATILRTDPLLLQFAVPEGDALQLHRDLPVRFVVPSSAGNDRGVSRDAIVQHVSQSADPTSRMVTVLAKITTPDASLRPGAFAEVAVTVAPSRPVTVVPQMAVRPSEKGFLAYVVTGDVAHERVLQLGMRTEDGRVEVKSGVTTGESLVIVGAEALREGAKVRVVPRQPVVPGKDKPASQDVQRPAPAGTKP